MSKKNTGKNKGKTYPEQMDIHSEPQVSEFASAPMQVEPVVKSNKGKPGPEQMDTSFGPPGSEFASTPMQLEPVDNSKKSNKGKPGPKRIDNPFGPQVSEFASAPMQVEPVVNSNKGKKGKPGPKRIDNPFGPPGSEFASSPNVYKFASPPNASEFASASMDYIPQERIGKPAPDNGPMNYTIQDVHVAPEKNNNIVVNFGWSGEGTSFSQALSDPLLIKGAALSDVTSANLSLVNRINQMYKPQTPAIEGEKLSRGDVEVAYTNAKPQINAATSVSGRSLQHKAAIAGITGVKGIMDSACLGETVLNCIHTRSCESMTENDELLHGLIEVYSSLGNNGLKMLDFYLEMSYCDIFELVSSDRLGAVNGLYSIRTIMDTLPFAAYITIPKGSGGQIGADDRILFYSLMLQYYFNGGENVTLIQTMDGLLSDIRVVTDTLDMTLSIVLPEIYPSSTTPSVFDKRRYKDAVLSSISSFREMYKHINRGICLSSEELTIYSKTMFEIYKLIQAIGDVFLVNQSESFTRLIDTIPQLLDFDKTTDKNGNVSYSDMYHSRAIITYEDFTWFSFEIIKYLQVKTVRLPSIESFPDIFGGFKEKKHQYSEYILSKEREFRSRWEHALQIVFQHEAMAGHDNKSAVLTDIGIELFPHRLGWLSDYRSDKGNFSWKSIESHIIKLIQQESRCTIFQSCPIRENSQLGGVLFSTNTNMVISRTISIQTIEPDAGARSIVKNVEYPTPNGLPFFDLFICNTGFGMINSTLDLENYESETTMAEKGASMIEAYPYTKRSEIPASSPSAFASSPSAFASSPSAFASSSSTSLSDDEEDTKEQMLQRKLLIGLTLQRNSYHDRIREWMGNINQIDCASRTNHPRAIYSSGRLTIPIRIPIGDNILTLSIQYNVGQVDQFYRVIPTTLEATELRRQLTIGTTNPDIEILLNFINENYSGNREDLLKTIKDSILSVIDKKKLIPSNGTSFTVAPKGKDFLNYMLLLSKLYSTQPELIKTILYDIIKITITSYVPLKQPGFDWNNRFAWLITENKLLVGRAILSLFSDKHKLEADPELKATILGTSQKYVSTNIYWYCPLGMPLSAAVASFLQTMVNDGNTYFIGNLRRMSDGRYMLIAAERADVVHAFAGLSDIDRFTTEVVGKAPSCPIGFENIKAIPTVNTPEEETAVLQTGFKYGLNVLADAAEFAADAAAFDASILVENVTQTGANILKANAATNIREDSSLGKGIKRKREEREECEPVVSLDNNVEAMRSEMADLLQQISQNQTEYYLQLGVGVSDEDLELINQNTENLKMRLNKLGLQLRNINLNRIREDPDQRGGATINGEIVIVKYVPSENKYYYISIAKFLDNWLGTEVTQPSSSFVSQSQPQSDPFGFKEAQARKAANAKGIMPSTKSTTNLQPFKQPVKTIFDYPQQKSEPNGNEITVKSSTNSSVSRGGKRYKKNTKRQNKNKRIHTKKHIKSKIPKHTRRKKN